ncbi:unnamed protein product [Soboliphyme baturini]|uniref:Integrin_alpha2 domain-containing protein n=1 Tax=Soboliphyme baturini TaxID=241478 RepID=A0A183J5U6_9BILA|nr:unnamed protein product [Soboliphyme baturini]
MKLCVSYAGKGVSDNLDFRFVIQLDAKKGNSSRARFLESSSVYKMTLDSVPLRKGEQWCERRYIYLIDEIRDKLSPIIVQVNYNISQDTFGSALTPIKDAYLPEVLTGEIQIQKDCGKDSICIPDLQLHPSLSKESVYVGADDRFNVSVMIHNLLEDAFEAQFFLFAPVGLDYEGFSRDVPTRPISCSPPKEVDDKLYVLVCDIGNPLPKNATVRFNMQFSTQNFVSSAGRISLKLITNSTNNESLETQADNENIIEIPLEVKADFIVTGVSKNETYGYQPSDFVDPTIFDSDAGPTVTHIYELILCVFQVRNLGPTTFSEASLDIYWPSFFKDTEKPLLYLVNDIQTEGRITCELIQKGNINPEGLVSLKLSTSF